ncbi:MAG TPA: hypothetical protein VFF24_13200, partial [Acidimicrobiia bacterium]|nr:hypothetical protein [Acidimicrobiia bacterium]
MAVENSAPAPAIRSLVRDAVDAAWQQAVAGGELPPVEPDEPPAVEVERPANPEHGDFATNLAMKLARPYRRSPLQIAEALAAALRGAGEGPVASAEAAAPGFVNLRLADRALEVAVAGILAAPSTWGRVAPVRPRNVNVEFVSA